MAKKRRCGSIQAAPVDRISDLPDGILHHILSYLSITDVAQTSVLSKRWLHLWDSYPILDFSQYDFYDLRKGIDDLDRFTDVVDRKLTSFCKYKYGIQIFSLCFTDIKPKYHSLVDKWMELVTERHVKELYLELNVRDLSVNPYLHKPRHIKPYCLPREIFAVKSLTVLDICSDKTLFPSSIRLPCLATLRLSWMNIDEMIFDDHKFPSIEIIRLYWCLIPRGFKISCHQLKELRLDDCGQSGKIEIIAPNLSSMSFYGGLIPTSSVLSLNVPFKLKKFMLSSGRCVNTSWYIKLKECLLQMQNRAETLFLLIDRNQNEKNTFDRDEASKSCLSPPYALQRLTLSIWHQVMRLDVEALINGFLWSFQPEILSVTFCIFSDVKRFLEVLFKTLGGREDHGCHSASKIKRRRHSFKVKHIIVMKYEGSKFVKEKRPFSWGALSKAAEEKIHDVVFT